MEHEDVDCSFWFVLVFIVSDWRSSYSSCSFHHTDSGGYLSINGWVDTHKS